MLRAAVKLPIKGPLLAHGVKVDVLDVKKAPNGQNLHRAMVVEGELNVNAAVTATVIEETRAKVIKNHTATHLTAPSIKRCSRSTCQSSRFISRTRSFTL